MSPPYTLSGERASTSAGERHTIRIFVVDAHELYRRGLEAMLGLEDDLEIVGESATAVDAVADVFLALPDVVLVDVRLPDHSGIDACAAIKDRSPETTVIMLTSSDEEEDLLDALKAGASGYMDKALPAHQIADGIRRAHSGERLVPPAMMARLISEFTRLSQDAEHSAPAKQLSRRELQVLAHVARGLSNREIARELYVSENTVKNHVRSILGKLEVGSRTEAALYAVRENLVPWQPERD